MALLLSALFLFLVSILSVLVVWASARVCLRVSPASMAGSMVFSFVNVSLLIAWMVKLVLSAVSFKWLIMMVTSLCSHSRMAISHFERNLGSSFSITIGLMLILSFVGVLPLAMAFDRASWWFEALSKVSVSYRYVSFFKGL